MATSENNILWEHWPYGWSYFSHSIFFFNKWAQSLPMTTQMGEICSTKTEWNLTRPKNIKIWCNLFSYDKKLAIWTRTRTISYHRTRYKGKKCETFRVRVRIVLVFWKFQVSNYYEIRRSERRPEGNRSLSKRIPLVTL